MYRLYIRTLHIVNVKVVKQNDILGKRINDNFQDFFQNHHLSSSAIAFQTKVLTISVSNKKQRTRKRKSFQGEGHDVTVTCVTNECVEGSKVIEFVAVECNDFIAYVQGSCKCWTQLLIPTSNPKNNNKSTLIKHFNNKKHNHIESCSWHI